MKKILSFIMTLCLILTPLNSIYAQTSNTELYLEGILAQAEDVKVLRNDDKISEAYAILDGVKSTIKWNRETNDVELIIEDARVKNSAEQSSFKIEINEDFEISDVSSYEGDNQEIQELLMSPELQSGDIDKSGYSNTRTVIVLGGVLGWAVLEALIAAAATVTILGVTYALATEVASQLRKKKHKHYQAAIRYSSKLKRDELFIGDPLGEQGAAGRLMKKEHNDVWSTQQSYAEKVARIAGEGNAPTAPEKHGGGKLGYYWHVHTWNRKGGHSFF